MKIQALPDRITSLVFFLLAILVMRESLNLSLGDIHNPGPGFIPFFLGLSLILLSSLNFCSPDRRTDEEAFRAIWKKGKNIFLIFAGLLFYLLLFNTLGFLINTFWLMIYLIRLAGAEGFKKGILISLLTIVVIYIIFYRLLIIPFPRGILGL